MQIGRNAILIDLRQSKSLRSIIHRCQELALWIWTTLALFPEEYAESDLFGPTLNLGWNSQKLAIHGKSELCIQFSSTGMRRPPLRQRPGTRESQAVGNGVCISGKSPARQTTRKRKLPLPVGSVMFRHPSLTSICT